MQALQRIIRPPRYEDRVLDVHAKFLHIKPAMSSPRAHMKTGMEPAMHAN